MMSATAMPSISAWVAGSCLGVVWGHGVRWRCHALPILLLAGCVSDPIAGQSDSSSITGTADGTTGTHGTAASPGSTIAADETAALACDDPEAAVAEIFADSCASAGCHGPDAAASLDLVSAGWPERLIGQPSSLCDGWLRVVPGDVAASLLVDKLRAPVACGEPMPIAAQLPEAEIECIEQWVSQLPPADCATCGGAACVDLDSDPAHCGGCDAPCPGGVACNGGTCACPEGTLACGDACVDPLADGQHCSGCDSPCMEGEVCLAGACASGCGALTECGGGCVDTDTHPLHCGGCDSPCEGGGACTNGTCSCPGDPLTYTADIEPLVVPSCATMGCHGFPIAQEELDLRTGVGYAAMVGVAAVQCPERLLVAPGQPSSSYLMNKMNGSDMCSGSRMPKGASPWSPDEIAMLSAWICQGAPE
jgi:hypothetical protein